MNKLAMFGGKPSSDHFIPYGKQSIDEIDIESVVNVLKSDYLTTGPYVKIFEEKVAKYVNSKYAVSFCNGTAALHAACYAAGIKSGDEVIVSSLTFAASSNCVLYMGAIPVFADVDLDTYNISTESIRANISSKTKAVIAVDYTGQAVNLDEIKKICEEFNLILIEDASHSIGTRYKDKMVGEIADLTTFSFHPVKTITSGEGGMVTTNNLHMEERLKLFASHGITRDEDILIDQGQESFYYEQQILGFNYRLTDIQCALGISQLSKIESSKARRKEIVNMYNEAFINNNALIVQNEIKESDTCRHLYVLRWNIEVMNGNRNEWFRALKKENIGVNVHYIPVYLHPYYQQIGYEKGLCPNAEEIFNSLVTIPLYPSMTNEEVHAVIEAVNKVTQFYSK